MEINGTLHRGLSRKDAERFGANLSDVVEMWPTPDANTMNDGESAETFAARKQRNIEKHYNGNGMGTPLAVAAQMWSAATTKDANSAARHTTTTGVMHPGTTLTDAVSTWGTPNAHDCKGGSDATSTQGRNLKREAELWSTPNTPNGGRSVDAETVENRGATEKGKRQVGLESEARHWRTPQMRDHHPSKPGNRTQNEDQVYLSHQTEDWRPLNEQALRWLTPCGGFGVDHTGKLGMGGEFAEQATTWQPPTSSHPPVPETGSAGPTCWCNTPGCAQPSHKRRLNPLFSAWLMGWPLHWANTEPTSCAASETESFLHVWRGHLSRLQSSTDSEPSGQMGLFSSTTERRLSL